MLLCDLPSPTDADAVPQTIQVIQTAQREIPDAPRRNVLSEMLRLLNGRHARVFLVVILAKLPLVMQNRLTTVHDFAVSVPGHIRTLDDSLCSAGVEWPVTTEPPELTTDGRRLRIKTPLPVDSLVAHARID